MKISIPANPSNEQEWQEAADAAEALLLLDSARQYGLVIGGPEINARRCKEILLIAKGNGIEPRVLGRLNHAETREDPREDTGDSDRS